MPIPHYFARGRVEAVGLQSKESPFANVVSLVGLDEEDEAIAQTMGRESSFGAAILGMSLQAGSYKRLADVIVEAELLADSARLGAKMKIRPRRATNERVAELSFWACWDWSWIVARGNRLIVNATIDCVVRQSSIYREKGLPGLRDLGLAPYEAVNAVPDLRRILRLTN